MVIIDEQQCKGCFLCIHYCPMKVLEKSDKRNNKGYIIPQMVDESKCTKCKTCELICPELAVTVEEGSF